MNKKERAALRDKAEADRKARENGAKLAPVRAFVARKEQGGGKGAGQRRGSFIPLS